MFGNDRIFIKHHVKEFEARYSNHVLIEHDNYFEYRLFLFLKPIEGKEYRIRSLRFIGSKKFGFNIENAIGQN